MLGISSTLLSFACARQALMRVWVRFERDTRRVLKKIMQGTAGEMLQHGPEGEVREVVVDLTDRRRSTRHGMRR